MSSTMSSSDTDLSVKLSIPVKSDLGIKFDGKRENFHRWRDALKTELDTINLWEHVESDNDPNPRSRLNILKEKFLGVQAVYNKMKVSDDQTTVTDAETFKKKSVDPAEAEFNAARTKLTAGYIKRWETNDNIVRSFGIIFYNVRTRYFLRTLFTSVKSTCGSTSCTPRILSPCEEPSIDRITRL